MKLAVRFCVVRLFASDIRACATGFDLLSRVAADRLLGTTGSETRSPHEAGSEYFLDRFKC
jgi:hypothetical protein